MGLGFKGERVSRLGISLLLVFAFCLRSEGAAKPPPKPMEPPQNKGGGDFTPPPPPVFPMFPQIGGGNGGGGGGGGEPEHPPVIVHHPPPPPPKPIEEFKIKEKKPVVVKPPHRRHPLFITHIERVYRSNVFFNENEARRDSNVTIAVSEAILSLETSVRESQNDVLAAKHEYESDLLKVETTKQIHEMNSRLYAKNVLTRQSFEESLAKLKKITHRVDEARARWKEFEAEVVINKWKLAQVKGATVSLIDKAKSYATLWEARLDKVKAAEGQAKAEYDYWSIVYDMQNKLYKASATSKEELINTQKELDEAGVVWKLAKVLIDNNSRFLDEARMSVKLAEQGETVPL